MISLRTFNLQKINEIEHYALIQSLARDDQVTRYISPNFPTWIKKQHSIGSQKIEVGKSYIIEKEGKYIGIVGSLNFSNQGILEVWYAIEKNLRGKGYGEKILGEITPYLIETVDGLNDIMLKINKENISSKKIAQKNGYQENLQERETPIETWYYFGQDYFEKNKKTR